VPGDEIVGYITRGKGVTVHRSICHNIASLDERMVNVTWNLNIDKKYPTSIIINAEKRDNFLLELISKTTSSDIIIQAINTINNQALVIYEITVLAENTDKLNHFMNDVYQINGVHKIERMIK
jgi:GTP pyrophosphokinase